MKCFTYILLFASIISGLRAAFTSITPNTLNWVISNSTCISTPECECIKIPNTSIIQTICQCSPHEKQIINLKGGKIMEHNGEVSWRIENCETVYIENNSLAAFGARSWILEFRNITNLNFQGDSFRLPVTTEGNTNNKSVIFNNCQIPDIPQNTFPSSLGLVKFINSHIEKISSSSFRPYYLVEIIFENSIVGQIEANAFSEVTKIDMWTVNNSTIRQMDTNGIESSIRTMTWSDSNIEKMAMMAMGSVTGIIANAIFHRTQFNYIETKGLAIRDWTRLSFINNTFKSVKKYGIDLSQHSTNNDFFSDFIGNTWLEVDPDFIFPGKTEKWNVSFFLSRDNNFEYECECEKSIDSLLTIQGSQPWFHEEILNHSRCSISKKSAQCLELEENYLNFDELTLLCSNPFYMCIKGLDEIETVRPKQLPDRLFLMAITIGGILAIVIISLLITICVFLFRRKKPSSTSSNSRLKSNKKANLKKRRLDGTEDCILYKKPMDESPNSGQTLSTNTTTTTLVRPRSILFTDQDIEREDKGVQTMPNELSSDILEGLREKLNRPDSFWDAKETVDHLYDLIQVKEKSSNTNITSPPDVTITMCNSSTTTENKPSPTTPTATPTLNHGHVRQNSNRNLKMPSIPISKSLNNMNLNNSRYAQIRPKQQKPSPTEQIRTTNTNTDAHPIVQVRNGRNGHIYSELLSGAKSQSQSTAAQQQYHENSNGTNKKSLTNGPILCGEYSEPKDVHSNIYSELAEVISINQRIPPEPPNNHTSSKNNQSQLQQSSKSNLKSNTNPCNRRPLPSIPPKPTIISSSHLI